MNSNTPKLKGAWLAIAAVAMTGNIALADNARAKDSFPLRTNIVIAKVVVPVNKASRQATIDEARDTALTEAVASIEADNKQVLDLRLSGRKSLLLVADL